MKPELQAYLLEGTPLPEGMALSDLLDADPAAAELCAELERIDAAASSLPSLMPPPSLVQDVLDQIDAAPAAPIESFATPEPANRPWKTLFGLALAAAAVLFLVWPEPSPPPAHHELIPRGVEEGALGPPIHLRMAVRREDGSIERLRRETAYLAGDTLLFRLDSPVGGWIHLLRVDEDGPTLIHTQQTDAGTFDLSWDGQTFGYELEKGERTAIFAILRHPDQLDAKLIQHGIGSASTPTAICSAARGMGAQCASEQVEAVP